MPPPFGLSNLPAPHLDWERFGWESKADPPTAEPPGDWQKNRGRFGRMTLAVAIEPRSGRVRLVFGGGLIRGQSCFAGSADRLRE